MFITNEVWVIYFKCVKIESISGGSDTFFTCSYEQCNDTDLSPVVAKLRKKNPHSLSVHVEAALNHYTEHHRLNDKMWW